MEGSDARTLASLAQRPMAPPLCSVPELLAAWLVANEVARWSMHGCHAAPCEALMARDSCFRPYRYAGWDCLVCCHGWVVCGAQGAQECDECDNDRHLESEES